MLEDDIDLVNEVLVCGVDSVDPIPAWERIKKELLELAQQSTNSAMDAICGQKLSCRFQRFADKIRCGAHAVIDCRHKQHQ